ncbi:MULTISPECIES: mechanosensitive ion channel family protein [unclassified Streptomyces]|uniref:mechanosensitive ion channel family protein n=1 Tax=unclassified Streptomyces TaxID=2593676 RepID=UPI00081B8813|nr:MULTISPECIES: mechanosensitive ion channel domain-containing protein [unclassified Streptomyces]MYQ50845.1 mechanosensitive ion channel [Streptomyces sp. SID4941]SCD48949.1 Mechanosensitive ion channel [Streptomyces sp. PalvLS-984]SDC42028.1 Small-conductance mechanosensitive channel [Streptomyces sp. AmelKG-A3]
MENVLRPLLVVGGSLVLTLVLGWLVDVLLRRADARHSETPLWGLLRRCRPPLQVVLGTALLGATYTQIRVDAVRNHRAVIGQTLTLVLIAASAWLVLRVAATIVESSYARYAAASRDAARVRRVRTQVTLIQRVVTAVVATVAIAAMLLTFPEMRTVGTSMLASAGVVGIVAGVAAQSTLGNLFAGFQIAFGDMVRLGDTVVVNGEWGTVDEITLTFLTVRTWDERRITMPVSYFTSQPFENWSRGGAQMSGTVYFQLDHSAPVPAMRDALRDILGECAAWDGRNWSLAVTDTTPTTMEVRAVVTAKDADDIWTVRCAVREQLIAWLRAHHPYALPRVTTAPASLPPQEHWAALTGADAVRGPAGNSKVPDRDRNPRTGRG